jgi:hypothetical protein
MNSEYVTICRPILLTQQRLLLEFANCLFLFCTGQTSLFKCLDTQHETGEESETHLCFYMLTSIH